MTERKPYIITSDALHAVRRALERAGMIDALDTLYAGIQPPAYLPAPDSDGAWWAVDDEGNKRLARVANGWIAVFLMGVFDSEIRPVEEWTMRYHRWRKIEQPLAFPLRLDVRRDCEKFVATYGDHEVADDCPVTACAKVLSVASGKEILS